MTEKASAFYEVAASGKGGVWAVPYHGARSLKPVKLPIGAILEAPSAEELARVPREFAANFELNEELQPSDPANPGYLDEDSFFIGLVGVFKLPSGHIGVVYGADLQPIKL
jgi:hypothetical protein